MDIVETYIEAAIAVNGLDLSSDAIGRVADQFRRIAALAQPVLKFELDATDEPTLVFTPWNV